MYMYAVGLSLVDYSYIAIWTWLRKRTLPRVSTLTVLDSS